MTKNNVKNNVPESFKKVSSALLVHKGLPAYLSQEDLKKAKAYVNHKPTMGDVFDAVEAMTWVHASKINELSKRISLASIMVDRLATKAGIEQDELDNMWKQAIKDLDKANKDNIKKAKKDFKNFAKKSKKEYEKLHPVKANEMNKEATKNGNVH